MLRKYGDDIELVVTTLGPGVNLLAKHPRRLIRPEQQQRVKSLAAYGVRFQACGNTMKSMEWTDKDMLADCRGHTHRCRRDHATTGAGLQLFQLVDLISKHFVTSY